MEPIERTELEKLEGGCMPEFIYDDDGNLIGIRTCTGAVVN